MAEGKVKSLITSLKYLDNGNNEYGLFHTITKQHHLRIDMVLGRLSSIKDMKDAAGREVLNVTRRIHQMISRGDVPRGNLP